MHGYRSVDASPPLLVYRRKKFSTRSAASTACSGSQSVITWPSPSYTASWAVRPRRLSATNIISACVAGQAPSSRPWMISRGVRIRSAR